MSQNKSEKQPLKKELS